MERTGKFCVTHLLDISSVIVILSLASAAATLALLLTPTLGDSSLEVDGFGSTDSPGESHDFGKIPEELHGF